ncbi:DUF3291 domain-containing protein [Mangrovivirga cuniculi]|uniref:DUF3291 domain-containing protein n=1 Tax=Mangrovivirga cuniculi TaxID=2715131 RepID=A0A4D7JT18_9BACT|nr:DUF3291 domain-containing protein [Mangrovivirga cuniculi]QCK16650.1 DUF3291 domain-containing protein [Mangrovivirga cuniculi]
MKATITSIKLKKPWHFFVLSKMALRIFKQLKTTKCKQYKSTGFWTLHYTMTLWEEESDMKEFAKSGAHLEAMKRSSNIASEIHTITINAKNLPTWKEAKLLLGKGKVLRY